MLSRGNDFINALETSKAWFDLPVLKQTSVSFIGAAPFSLERNNFKKVEEAGYEVDFVSPKGGYTPIDPHSLAMADPTDWEWYQKKKFMNRLGTTLKPSEVNPDDYVAIYYTGGHGVIWDFPENEALQSISRKIYENRGFVSSVCHGAVGLAELDKFGPNSPGGVR